jgi:hypothetical protein
MNSFEKASLFEDLLGKASLDLPDPLRRLHFSLTTTKGKGQFNLFGGKRPFARFIGRLLQLPSEGIDVPTRLTITRQGEFETWKREFGNQCIVTKQYSRSGLLAERFGRLLMLVQLSVVDGALIFKQVGAALCFGPLTISLPRFLSPWVISRCWVNDKEMCVRVFVEVTCPLIGTLFRYEGYVEEERPQ